MAENTGSNRGLGQPPEQLSTETRLLLAFLLMGAIMFFTPYFFKPQNPLPGGTKSTQPALESKGNPAATSTQAPPPAETAETTQPPTAPTAAGQAEPNYYIQTDLYTIAFSNQGGTVRSWQLKKEFAEGKPLELVNTMASSEDPWPFSLYLPDQKAIAKKLNTAFYQKTVDPDGLGVVFDYSDGHTVVRKSFRLQKNSYLLEVSSEVTTDGKPVTNLLEWRGGFGDFTVTNPSSRQQTIFYDQGANKLVEQTISAAKNGPAVRDGNFSFAGIEDAYFTAVFLPEGTANLQEITFKVSTRTPFTEKPTDFVGAAVSMGPVNHFKMFVGPKDYDLLKRVDPKLEQLVNFGWMSLLAKPLFLVVNWANDNIVLNFGWAIILVTVVINFALFPLKLSNMKSMRKMQALKPQVDAINNKYKGISMRDPKAADKNQEVMELYKKHGVNPMGGCVPMLLQIPFFIAFYKVFMVSVEMRGASWLWVGDLSQPEHLPIRILPVVMVASQFFMQKMTPQPNQDPSQQKMMMFMPLVFGFMFYNFPSGLVLYYLTSNLVNMGQQWFFNHTEAATEAARSVEPPKKKNGRK